MYTKKEKMRFYLNIQDEINAAEAKKQEVRGDFYDKSFGGHQFFDLQGNLITASVRPNDVIDMVDALAQRDRRIEGLKKKQHYVEDYLQRLSRKERFRLVDRCQQSSDDDTISDIEQDFYDELLEIEEAINYMRGIEPEPIDDLQLDNDHLEEDFNAILKMIGV